MEQRLIDANAFVKAFWNDRRFVLFDGSRMGVKDYLVKVGDVLGMMERAPTIDAAPVVHGRWEDHTISPTGIALPKTVCSVCKHYTYQRGEVFLSTYKYCPNCGAKMDGGAE